MNGPIVHPERSRSAEAERESRRAKITPFLKRLLIIMLLFFFAVFTRCKVLRLSNEFFVRTVPAFQEYTREGSGKKWTLSGDSEVAGVIEVTLFAVCGAEPE